jgi:hypothetical protein
MWRSVLLHAFPDEDIGSLQALPGSLTPDTLALNPHRGGVQITPGRGFEYSLAQPLDDIIGVSGRVRLRYPIQGVTHPVPIMRAGDTAAFGVQPLPLDPGAINPPELAAPARTLLRIEATEVQLGVVMLPHRRFVNLRFDWHTSGQARLLLDGRLVGYQNALSPAARLTVADIAFGLADWPSTATSPRYEVGRLFVRALARSDSLAAVSREFPAIDLPDDDLFARCRLRMTVNLLAKLDRLRAFMAQVHQALSQPWSQEAGPAEGPFTPDATLAHDLSRRAVVELRSMLRSGDFTMPERFLAPFTQCLEILHRALPAEFQQLAAELGEPPVIPEECRAAIEEVLAQGRRDAASASFLALLAEANERINQIVGVD